jgi:hypothetical protein
MGLAGLGRLHLEPVSYPYDTSCDALILSMNAVTIRPLNPKACTITTHRPSCNAIQPILGKRRLDEITPFDLERYRRHRKQLGRPEVTMRCTHQERRESKRTDDRPVDDNLTRG